MTTVRPHAPRVPVTEVTAESTGASPAMRPCAWKSAVLHAAVVALVTLALLEAVVAFSFAFPSSSLIPMPMLRTMYMHFDRQVIQMMPECARYDEHVTYTLRPGSCTFANREFSNVFRINALGVRDDEMSLGAPEIVVLGDSVAMGWGVEQDQSFPAVLERMTAQRLLNTGISSFGTFRELQLLGRVDRSALRHVVIQYSDNDFRENLTFLAEGRLPILSEDEYARKVTEQKEALRYVPGKYAFNVGVQFWSAARRRLAPALGLPSAEEEEDWRRHAAAFVEVLRRSPVELSRARLTVVSLYSGFIDALRDEVAASQLPWIAGLQLVDAGAVTRFPGAYFVLDDHPTAPGHDAIGRVLYEALGPDIAR
jgi:hypothetical protein